MSRIKIFEEKLSKYRKVALDVMCFVYFFEENPKYSQLCQKIFQLAQENKIKISTSILCYTEIQIGPKKSKNIPLERKYRNIFNRFPNLEVKFYDWQVAEITSNLRAKYNIRLPDAINLASAILANTEVFITNDKNLCRFREIKTLLLSNFV